MQIISPIIIAFFPPLTLPNSPIIKSMNPKNIPTVTQLAISTSKESALGALPTPNPAKKPAAPYSDPDKSLEEKLLSASFGLAVFFSTSGVLLVNCEDSHSTDSSFSINQSATRSLSDFGLLFGESMFSLGLSSTVSASSCLGAPQPGQAGARDEISYPHS